LSDLVTKVYSLGPLTTSPGVKRAMLEESVISSAIQKDGRLLVLANGAYGHRIAAIARIHHIATDTAELGENQNITAAFTSDRMRGGVYSHAAVVHCETTTGIITPIEEIGAVVQNAEASYIVDAMSSFGAIPVDVRPSGADFLISSANKCIQGVPGFAFLLARRARESKRASPHTQPGPVRTMGLVGKGRPVPIHAAHSHPARVS
jgi:2-aminoethylphosphonate-pyruvate transaminase